MTNLSPEQLTFLATSIAVELTKDKDIDEISVLKSVISQVCDSINTIVAQRCLLEKKCKDFDKK